MSRRPSTRSHTARSSSRDEGEPPRIAGYGPRATIPPIGFLPDPESLFRRSNSQRSQATTRTRRTEGEESTDEERTTSISLLFFRSDCVADSGREPDVEDSEGESELSDDDMMLLSFFDFMSWVDEIEQEQQIDDPNTLLLPGTSASTESSHRYTSTDLQARPEEAETRQRSSDDNLRLEPHSLTQQQRPPTQRHRLNAPRTHDSEHTPSPNTLATAISPLSSFDVPHVVSSSSVPSFNDANATRDGPEEPPTDHSPRRVSDFPSSSDSDTSRTHSSDAADGGDSEQDENNQGSNWWDEEDDTPQVSLRAPSTADECAAKYNAIKPHLELYLSDRYMGYFFAPVIVVRKNEEDIATVVILVDERDEDKAPTAEDLSPVVDGSGFVIVIGYGDLTSSTSTNSSSNAYHDNINSGDSIEVIQNEHGTLGIFVQGEEKLMGVTAGHVMAGTTAGSNVIQPSLYDFKAYYDDVRRRVAVSTTNLSISIPSKIEDARKELESWTKLLAKLEEVKGESDDETRSRLVIGKTVKWELKAIKYKHRRCYSDWGIIDILDARRPTGQAFLGHSFHDHPQEEWLKSLEWKSVSGWLELDFDQYVRKTGRTTGLTYGFVAGVHAGWKNPLIPSKKHVLNSM